MAGGGTLTPVGGTVYNVTVNVQGNVTSENDLAATIREKLIRTGSRNISVGLT